MLNQIAANVIAGLGVFFSGLKLVDSHLRQVTGRQLRAIIGTLTRRPLTASAVGLAVGVVMQSTSGIAFILVSLVSSGLTTVRRALPVMTWANVGCSALVFATVLDLRLAILYLIGVAGAAYAFDRSHKSHAIGAIFGIGMLFYGIELMKLGAEPLKDLPWLSTTLNGAHSSYLLAFAGGLAMSFVTQSSVAVSILAIGLARAGLLGSFQTMMGIYGANVGSTFARMVLSSGLRGSVRQLTAYQDLFKVTGALLFVALLYVEVFTQVPLVRALVEQLSPRLDRQMASVFLVFNLVTALVFTAGQGAIAAALERWLPADTHEDLSKAQFLYEEALDTPATALDLIEKEQLRLAQRLRVYPRAMRRGAGSAERAQAAQAQKPFAALAAQIDQFQHELVNRQLGADETERLTNLQNRLSLLVYIDDSLRTLTASTEAVRADSSLAVVLSTFVEALDFVLMTMEQVLDAGDRAAHDLLVLITGDRGDMLERIRQEYLSDERSLSLADRAVLLQTTSTFERIIWMAQRFARLIAPGAAEPVRLTADRTEPEGALAGAEEMPSV